MDSTIPDDFVPFVVDRLNKLRRQHNILLVTNDHVETLTKMADNTITVSAIDRTKVKVNDEEGVDRNLVLIALSVGYEYEYQDADADRKLFIEVEITSNKAIRAILAFTLIAFTLFIATFWDAGGDSGEPTYNSAYADYADPSESTAALTLIAAGVIAFFSIQPYLVTLTDWRDCMLEEAEALVHSSPGKSKALKTFLTLALIFIISVVQYIALNIATKFGDYAKLKFWIAMLGELFFLCFPPLCLGIFSRLPFQVAQLLSGLPFLLVVFFSTTYSPGAGVEGLKGLRYLFSRFYYFCMLENSMGLEGCPENEVLNILLLILTSLISLFVFLAVLGVGKLRKDCAKHEAARLASNEDALEVERLQEKLYSNDETIISLCAPPTFSNVGQKNPTVIRPPTFSNEGRKNPTVIRPDPSGLNSAYLYPKEPKFNNRSDPSFYGMTILNV